MDGILITILIVTGFLIYKLISSSRKQEGYKRWKATGSGNTTDGAALIIAREGYNMIYGQMAERAQVRAERYIFGKARVGIVFAGLDGTVQAVSSRAKEILEEEKWNIH